MKILLVEDNPGDARLVMEAIKGIDFTVANIFHAEYLKDAKQILEQEEVDLILLDLFLPDSQGVETLQKIEALSSKKNIPIVVLTGLYDEKIFFHDITNKIQNYLLKDDIDENILKEALRYAAGVKHGVKKEEASSLLDEKTGFYNLKGFFEVGENFIRILSNQEEPIIAVLVILQEIKKVSLNLGSQVENQYLSDVSKLLRIVFQNDQIFRIHYEYCVILLKGDFEKKSRLSFFEEKINEAKEQYLKNCPRPYQLDFLVKTFYFEKIHTIDHILKEIYNNIEN